MACGTPVVASTASCLPEVAGDAALLVPPTEVEALAHALNRVHTDENLRARLIAKGAERVCQFSWEKSARQLVEIYRAIKDDGVRG
jgi:glycosyltransferase involved in cell wall biosynthesis